MPLIHLGQGHACILLMYSKNQQLTPANELLSLILNICVIDMISFASFLRR